MIVRLGAELLARRRAISWLGAIGYLLIAVNEMSVRTSQPLWIIWFVALGSSAPIALITMRPALSWIVACLTAWMVGAVWPVPNGDPWPWPVTSGLVVILSVVVVAITSRFVVTVVTTAMSALLFSGYATPSTAVGWGVGIALFAGGGVLIRWRTHLHRELGRQEELSEVEKARRTVLEERARIARDMHDVVAHRMSLVVVAAETAPYRIAGVTDPVRAELDLIGATAREALTEMRALLGVLRSADATPAYAPQPGLDDLGSLVAQAVRAGLHVDLGAAGARRPVSGVVGLSAYRVVQESLANAARHAPGEPVRVCISYLTDLLRVEIVNGPYPWPGERPPAGPHGHGLTGMAERAAAVGGRLEVGPQSDGTFLVRAELPTTVDAAS